MHIHDLPEHLYNIINEYNSLKTTVVIYKTCNKYKTLLQDKRDHITVNVDDILNIYNNKIIKLVGGIEQMLEYPVLQWNEEYLGATGYIDRLNVDNVSHKIMKGSDGWGRPFITFRIKNENSTYYKHNIYTCVLFQRYTDSKESWTHSTRGGPDILSESGHFMIGGNITHSHIQYNMYNLINNKGFIYRTSLWSPYNIETVEGITLV
jgi:hypothetical protein